MNSHSVRGGGDKRERILHSAERVFALKGYYGAKVSDIAEDAGVADGTIYLYFKSKDDLLISLFEAQMERVHAALAGATEGVADASEKLRRFIRAYMDLTAENRHGAEVIAIELRQSAKFMKEYKNPRFAEFLKLLAGIIAEGQKSGAFRADVPAPVAARALFGALDELTLAWVTSRDGKIDIRKTGDWIGNLVLQGLEDRQGGRR
jgi:TetR/AcrR family fatty acid metabolism transcriptional regulator